jgi:hypothetical protein
MTEGDIKTMEDWYRVSVQDVKDHGGYGWLSRLVLRRSHCYRFAIEYPIQYVSIANSY